MILCFILSMPNIGSHNGSWTSDGEFFAKVVNLGRTKKAIKRAESILAKAYHRYDFGDGWAAGVTITEIDAKEAAKVRRKSKGFCGYDWMIKSILNNNKIIG